MNYISRLSGVLPVLALVALALSVFGCSGGDSSTTPRAPSDAPTPTTQEPSTAPPAQTTRNEDIIRNAAANIPVAGSVSQGSRRGQSQQGVVTQDSVTWNGSGGRDIRVTIGSAAAQPDPEANNTILDDVDPPDGVIDLVTVPNSGSASSAIVHAVSDIDLRTRETSGEFTPTFSGDRDDPDLVFGIWATADADSGDITAIGAFADGTETPSAAIPTSGTYTGNLLAFHQSFDSDDDIEQASYSVARVELTVGTNGSVSGRVFNIADKEDPDSNAFTFIDAGAGGAIVVTMASATRDSQQDGGFFYARTSFSRGGSTSSAGVDDSEGRWGGQFFGDRGQYIAGTVGLNIDYSDGTSSTVFGSFSAERN